MPALGAFNGDRLGVHRHIERTLERAPREQRHHQEQRAACQTDERTGRAVAQQAYPDQRTAAEHGKQSPRDQHRADRADRRRQQHQAEGRVR